MVRLTTKLIEVPTLPIFQLGAVSFGLALLRIRAVLSFGVHCIGAARAAPLNRIVVIAANNSLFIKGHQIVKGEACPVSC